MINLLKYTAIGIVLISIAASAQIQPSISNYFRYGNGKQVLGDINENFVYRENLTDVRLQFPQNFTAGVRFLFDIPPEVGQRFKGISRRFVEYKKDDLNLRVGNFSELYGQGLAVNLFEERGLAYDTWADGLRGSYEYNNLKASVLYGSIDFADSINFWREENYILTGGNLEYEFDNFLKAGLSYIDAEGKIPLNEITYNLRAEVTEAYLKFDLDPFDWLINYSNKWTNVIGHEVSDGWGIYSYLSFNTSGFGILLDYKNYLFDERNPIERYDFTRPTRMLPFQNPPIVQKEHSYLFLSRTINDIDFNDNVGFQLEAFYALADFTYLNFNASLASRHNLYEYNPESFDFKRVERDNNFIPSTDLEYSPFWEYFIEVEHSIGFNTTINAGFARRENVLYNDFTGRAGTHIIQSTIIPVLVDHTFNRDYSAQLQYEIESVHDNFNEREPEYLNQFISILGNFYSTLSLNLRYEFTNNDFDLSGRKDWFTVETSYRISQSHTVTASYGRERGGQTCSNGVCRYVLPFEGFKFSLISNF